MCLHLTEMRGRVIMAGLQRCYDECGALVALGWGFSDGGTRWIFDRNYSRQWTGQVNRGSNPPQLDDFPWPPPPRGGDRPRRR